MSYSLTVTHVDEVAITRILQIGRQGVSGGSGGGGGTTGQIEWGDIEDAPLADPSELQYLFGWNGTALVRVNLDALTTFLGLASTDDDDYAAWVAAF
jgi:hypothetical protein